MKQKISKEEKRETRQEKKSFNDLVRRAKAKNALMQMPSKPVSVIPQVGRLIILLFIFCSCSKEVTKPDQSKEQHQFTATVSLTQITNHGKIINRHCRRHIALAAIP